MDNEKKNNAQKTEWWKETPIYVKPLPPGQTAADQPFTVTAPQKNKKWWRPVVIGLVIGWIVCAIAMGVLYFSSDAAKRDMEGAFVLFIIPFFLIWLLIKAIFNSAFASANETGITWNGELRYQISTRWNSEDRFELLDENNILELKSKKEQGRCMVYKYKPVKEGTAMIAAIKDGSGYSVYQITSDGKKVTSFTEEKITAFDYEELTGEVVMEEDAKWSPDNIRDELFEKGELEKLRTPASEKEINAWEKETGCEIKYSLEDFYELTNGFEYGDVAIYPLEELSPDNRPDGCSAQWFTVGKWDKDTYIVSGKDGRLTTYTAEGDVSEKYYDFGWIERHVIMTEIKKENSTDEKDP